MRGLDYLWLRAKTLACIMSGTHELVPLYDMQGGPTYCEHCKQMLVGGEPLYGRRIK